MCVSLSTNCFVWRGLRYCGFVGLDFGYCRWQNQRKMRTTEFQTVFDMQRQQPEKIYCYYLSSLMLALNNGHMWVMPDGTISKPLCSSFLCWPAKFWEYCKKTRRNSSVFTGTDRSIRFDFKKSSPYSRVDLVAFAAPTNNGSLWRTLQLPLNDTYSTCTVDWHKWIPTVDCILVQTLSRRQPGFYHPRPTTTTPKPAVNETLSSIASLQVQ